MKVRRSLRPERVARNALLNSLQIGLMHSMIFLFGQISPICLLHPSYSREISHMGPEYFRGCTAVIQIRVAGHDCSDVGMCDNQQACRDDFVPKQWQCICTSMRYVDLHARVRNCTPDLLRSHSLLRSWEKHVDNSMKITDTLFDAPCTCRGLGAMPCCPT